MHNTFAEMLRQAQHDTISDLIVATYLVENRVQPNILRLFLRKTPALNLVEV